MLQGFIN